MGQYRAQEPRTNVSKDKSRHWKQRIRFFRRNITRTFTKRYDLQTVHVRKIASHKELAKVTRKKA